MLAAIFDIDGTLIDSVDAHARAWQLAFEHYGKKIPFEDVRHQIGKGGDQLMPVFLSKDELNRFGEELEKYRGDLYKREFMHTIKPFPGVRDLFEGLKAEGMQIVLASSAKADELEYYKKLCNISDLLEGHTSADDAEKSKPHPDIFEAALKQCQGISPDQAVVFGDTPYDAIAANRAGMRCIGVLCGGFPEQELRDAGCVAIYRDAKDLLANLDVIISSQMAA